MGRQRWGKGRLRRGAKLNRRHYQFKRSAQKHVQPKSTALQIVAGGMQVIGLLLVSYSIVATLHSGLLISASILQDTEALSLVLGVGISAIGSLLAGNQQLSPNSTTLEEASASALPEQLSMSIQTVAFHETVPVQSNTAED